MTLNEALEKAGRRFDEIAADHLAGWETTLRHHNASAEEIEIEVTRLRAQYAEDRQRLLAAIVAAYYSWSAEAPIWKAPASAWLH